MYNVSWSGSLTENNYQVKVDRVGLRVHLCADSLAAITAFAGDLTTIFKPPGDDLYVIFDSHTTTYRFTFATSPSRPKRQPTVVSKQSTTNYSIMSNTRKYSRPSMTNIVLRLNRGLGIQENARSWAGSRYDQ